MKHKQSCKIFRVELAWQQGVQVYTCLSDLAQTAHNVLLSGIQEQKSGYHRRAEGEANSPVLTVPSFPNSTQLKAYNLCAYQFIVMLAGN